MKSNCPIIRPTDPSFQEAAWARVFNKRRDASDAARAPHAVAKPRNAAELAEAVKLAIAEGARISVRSGGHSWAAWSVRTNALILDLGDFNEIDYDDETKIVKVTSRVTGRMLNGLLKERGRFFPGGHCPDVGVGGFLLQGGMGWVCKSWGWACEHIHGIDVITADGRQLYCDEKENPDLFFAARGAGPGFPALIVRFHLKTFPFLDMYKNVYIYPLAEYKRVLQWVVDTARKCDRDTEAVCLATTPPGFDGPICLAAYSSLKATREEAEAALRPIHSTRPEGPMVDKFCKLSSLDCEYDDQARANPENHRYSSENAYIANDADVPAVLEKAFTTLPSKKAFALYFAMAPTSRRYDPALPGGIGDKGSKGLKEWPDMALSMQSDHYFALYTVWEDESEDDKCKSWNAEVMKDVAKHSVGAYLGDSDFRYRRTKFWDDEQAKRLKEVRQKWDPTGVFAGYLELEDNVAAKAVSGDRRDVGNVIENHFE